MMFAAGFFLTFGATVHNGLIAFTVQAFVGIMLMYLDARSVNYD